MSRMAGRAFLVPHLFEGQEGMPACQQVLDILKGHLSWTRSIHFFLLNHLIQIFTQPYIYPALWRLIGVTNSVSAKRRMRLSYVKQSKLDSEMLACH